MDPVEFRRWYDTVANDLHRYVRRLADSVDEAEDLFQETLARFLGSGFDSDDLAQRRRYLFRIATNLARDRQRRSRRWILGSLVERSGDAPEQGYSDRINVQRALARLPRRSRALLWLAYVEGMEHREIAEIVGVASKSVRVLLSRARKSLLRNLERSDR